MESKSPSGDKAFINAGLTLPTNSSHTHQTSRKRRAVRGLLLIACAWLLSRALFKTGFLLPSDGEHDWPVPPNVELDHCADLQHDLTSREDHAPYSTPAIFDLPLLSKGFFFLSRGALSTGVVNIVQSTSEGDGVVVDVDVNYWERPLLDNLKVCQLKRGDGEVGVGIFSDWLGRPRARQVEFEVTISLPAPPKDAIHYIKSLETDMPMFEHWIGELGDSVHFKSISLSTENRGVDVASLSATTAIIKNSHSSIQGVVNASSSLSLVTSNSLINVFLGLSNNDGEEATRLEMKTSNYEITASIGLTSTARTGGKYDIVAATNFGKIHLEFPESPVDSTLLLDARTSFAPVEVSLHSAYEGNFTVDTSVVGAHVTVDPHVEDPSGEKRERNVDMRRVTGWHVEGSVSWSEAGQSGGNVKLASVLGSVNLKL